PAWNDEAQRRALVFRQRLAVERVREDRIGAERLVARQAAAERLIELDLRLPEVGFLFAVIGAEEHDLVTVVLQPGRLEHLPQRSARPHAVAGEALDASAAVAGALEAERDVHLPHRLDLIDRERLRTIDEAGDL